MTPQLVKTRLDLIKMLPPGTVGAEIGVWRGYFSVAILETPVARLYLVDPWCSQPKDEYDDTVNDDNQWQNLEETQSNVTGFGDRCVIVRGFSAVVAERNLTIPPLDWVYIDANHAYDRVMEDLRLWSCRLKPNGIIMGHDYVDSAMANAKKLLVRPAVDDFCNQHGWILTHLTEDEYPSYRLEYKKNHEAKPLLRR